MRNFILGFIFFSSMACAALPQEERVLLNMSENAAINNIIDISNGAGTIIETQEFVTDRPNQGVLIAVSIPYRYIAPGDGVVRSANFKLYINDQEFFESGDMLRESALCIAGTNSAGKFVIKQSFTLQNVGAYTIKLKFFAREDVTLVCLVGPRTYKVLTDLTDERLEQHRLDLLQRL